MKTRNWLPVCAILCLACCHAFDLKAQGTPVPLFEHQSEKYKLKDFGFYGF